MTNNREIRTVTIWINKQLKREQIKSIYNDFKDGKILVELLSIVTNNPTLQPEQDSIDNVTKALDYLQEEFRDELPRITIQDIINGDHNSTFSLLTFIMFKHQFLYKKVDMKKELLDWIDIELTDYITNGIISPIKDFSKSWTNGLLFCLLIHKIEPDWIRNLSMFIQSIDQKETWVELLELAFSTAEKELNIPRYLEIEDLLESEASEYSIMIYASEFYNRSHSLYWTEDEEHKMKRLQDITVQKTINKEQKLINNNNQDNNQDPLQDIANQLDPLAINVFDHISNNLLKDLLNTDSQHLPFNIHLLSLRFRWEQYFIQAVQWISETHLELNQFISFARWSGKEDMYSEEFIENIIQSLITLEGKLSVFDQGLYSNIINLYQKMDTICTLPEHIESRQSGFESAFDDLLKQSEFSRKTVEQLLSVIGIVEKFHQSRVLGEELREELSSDVIQIDTNAQDVYQEKVYSFKQDSARLIQSASTCIPYPPPPDMKTAMGTDDLYHSTEMTKEAITSTINAYSMSLTLTAEGLDQLLNSRDQTISFQQRVSDTQEFMKSIQSWINQAIASLTKFPLNTVLFSQSLHQSLSSSSSSSFASLSEEPSVINEEEIHRLDKERDQMLSHLSIVENDDMIRLEEVLKGLDQDMSINWSDNLENLKRTHQILTHLLFQRGLELDALKSRVEWESQWTKYHNQLVTLAKKTCDFNVKKARYDPSKENPDRPSYDGDHDLVQSFQWMQDRQSEISDRPLSLVLDSYQNMISAYFTVLQTQDESALPEFLALKQSDIKLKHEDLKQLLTYTSDLMVQRSTITEFLMRVRDTFHEGEKIKDLLSKRLRRMNEEDQDQSLLEKRIGKFRGEIKTIWSECGEHMPYPVYSGNWLRQQSSEAAATYRAHVRTQVKSLVDKKFQDLENLERSLDQILLTYREADRMKQLVAQYEKDADELRRWIEEQIEILRAQHIEVSAESILVDGNLKDLEQSRQSMWSQVQVFEQEKVKSLHDHIVQLIEASMKKSKNVDVTMAARHLGAVMEHLSQLKQGLSDQAVTLEAAGMRTAWENKLNLGIRRLEEMGEQLREFTAKKNLLLSREDLCDEDVQILETELGKLMSLRTKFERSLLPDIQMSYDAFTEYFPKLPRPIAVPDHLEVRMESLGRSCSRFQETVTARSRELGLIKQRVSWESTVKRALEYLAEKELEIDSFVDQKARWNTTTASVINDNDEEQLRTEWRELYDQFEIYQDQVIVSIQRQFESLTKNTADYDHRLIPQAKKMSDLETAKGRIEHILSFSNDVVSQRCLVSAFILRTAQLEQSAELIREEFIASNDQKEKDVIVLLENHSERLQKFKTGIEDVRYQLAASIPYPVRSSQYISADVKMSDEATNAAINETIDTRNARLSELWSSLEQMLATRERISRRRLSIHTFKKRATHTETWIDARNDLLDICCHIEGIEAMEKALSDIMSIQQAMKANETSFVLLSSAYEACKSAFQDESLNQVQSQDENDEMVRELTNDVHPTYDRLNQKWNKLILDVEEAHHKKHYLLIDYKLNMWLQSTKDLLESTFTDSLDIVEKSMALWQNQIAQLETSGYQHKTDLETIKELLGSEKYKVLSEMYQKGSENINKINAQLSHQQKTQEINRLTTRYLADLKSLQEKILEYFEIYKNIESNYKLVSLESNIAREDQHQKLVTEYKSSFNQVECLKDFYKDVGLQLVVIQKENSDYVNEAQVTLDKTWSELSSFESVVASLVSRTASWVQYFNGISKVEKDMDEIKTKMENASEFDDLMQLDSQMAVIDGTLSQDLTISSQELLNDICNMENFETLRSKLVQEITRLKQDTFNKIKDKNKFKLIDHIKKVVDRLSEQCEKQTNALEKHKIQNVWSEHCSDNLHSLLEKYSKILETSKTIVADGQLQLDDLKAIQCQELESSYNYSENDSLLKPIIDALVQLKNLMDSVERYSVVLCKIRMFKGSESQIAADMVYIQDTSAKTIDNEMALADIERHAEFLEEQGVEFFSAIDTLDLAEYKLTTEQESGIREYINVCRDRVHSDIKKAKEIIKYTRAAYEKMIECQRIVSKLKEIIQFVNDISGKLQDLQSSKKYMFFAELDTLCQHYDAVFPTKKAELEELISSFFATPAEMENFPEIDSLYQEMIAEIDRLELLISSRKKETFDENDDSQINKLMELFEEEIKSLVFAIDNASPNGMNIPNEKNVKANLQSLLRSLIDSYKRHQPKIMRTLDQIRIDSKKLFSDNHSRVEEWLEYATKKASNTRAAAAARERELQDSINQLNSDFFNKLATSRPRRVLPSAPAPATHNKRASENSGAKTNFSSPATPLPMHKRVNPIDSNQRKPPNASSAPSNNDTTYVPDPKNALDVEMSHIINASPHRVTIKMIPGEVGKYWFGDVNPRLVYCRILPSQLVMVRVGGGWEELSKFLRDHGLSEVSHNKINTPADEKKEEEPFQESFLQTARPVSPSGRTTIRGGGNISSSLVSTRSSSKSSGSRSRSPLPGFMDGDKYVSTDEAGNHLVVKMKKAEDDAKMPLVKKKL